MTITKIDLGSFSVPIENKRLAAALERLDNNHDTVVDIRDIQLPFGVSDDGIRNTLLKKAVAAAFVESGSISKNQQSLLENYIDLYKQVHAFRSAVDVWHRQGVVENHQGQKALSFNYDSHCRNSNYATLPGNGSFTTLNIGGLAEQLQNVLHGLARNGQNDSANYRLELVIDARQACHNSGIHYYNGITYNLHALPRELQPSAQQMVSNYLTGAAWLFQFDEVYCGSNNVKSGDNSISGLRNLNTPWLRRIDAGASNSFHMTTALPICTDYGL